MNKKILTSLSLVPLIIFGVTGTLSSSSVDAAGVGTIDIETRPAPLEPERAHKQLTKQIVDQVKLNHFSRQKPLNDEVSEILFERFLERLDPRKNFFLKSDIKEFEPHKNLFDDYLKSGKLDVAFEIFNRIQKREFDRFTWVLKRLSRGINSFDLDTNDVLRLDRDEQGTWLANKSEANKLWEKYLVDEIIRSQLRDPEEDPIEFLTRTYTQALSREVQTISEDAYSAYMNSFSTYYDPHTEYLNPRESDNFDIQMSLSLFGIGAILEQGPVDGYIEIRELIKGCPAEKTEGVEEGDRIVGVGQRKDAPIIDIRGKRLDQVVTLIRGPKDTTVFLELLSSDDAGNERKFVQIVRDECKIESSAAQKKIVELDPDPVTGEVRKIGVIDLPSMYVDFDAQGEGEENYRSATRDVEQLIDELKEEGIVGLIIDLRRNGGGSLAEANTLTGLFIPFGPTVQVKNARGQVIKLQDRDNKVAWGGPLAVLVDRRSASASEIFAGAIQDYGRGIILGNRTYGKGTVQTLQTLSHGKLKITQSKFYRVSGQSTQNKGVVPDIEFPELIDPQNIGESNNDEALKFDIIDRVSRKHDPLIGTLLPRLTELHRDRIADNPHFRFYDALEARIKRDRDRETRSLNFEARERERNDYEDWRIRTENELLATEGYEPVETMSELRDTRDEIVEDREENGVPDALLIESAEIIIDFLELKDEVTASNDTETTGI
ncbi:MAG: tail-specific protease [Gammaproteobacteria bacterium]|nr:tail-specific protease [Gammaproteobacteria bacterium]